MSMIGGARTLSLSRSGRFVVVRRDAAMVDVIDALGTSPLHSILLDTAIADFTCVGTMLWIVTRDGVLHRYRLDGARAIPPDTIVISDPVAIEPSVGDHAASALVRGATTVLAFEAGMEVSTAAVSAPGTIFPLSGRRVLAIDDDIRVIGSERNDVVRMPRLDGGPVVAAKSILSGRAVALVLVGTPQLVVLRPGGGVVHRIPIPKPVHWAIAENRGVAVIGTEDGQLVVVDLRYGRIQERFATQLAVDEIAIDADAQFVAFSVAADTPGDPPRVDHIPYTELIATARREAAEAGDTPVVRARPLADAADAEPVLVEPAPAPPPIIIPERPARAFGDALPPLVMTERSDMPPYDSASEHVDELLDVISARAGRAIARAWNSGRLSVPTDDVRPFEREVLAILGRVGAYAQDLVVDAEQRFGDLTRRVAGRATATIAAGRALAFVELSREMNLSATASQVLLAVAAPQIRGEIARLYGVLANDEHRPLVDRFLIEALIAGDDPSLRADVAAELAPDAPLLRFGLVRHDGDSQLFGALSVDPVLVDRIRGRESGNAIGITRLRDATRRIDELVLPELLKREIVLAVAEPRPSEAPLRLVLRGRRGSGRHSLVAALAATIGHRVAEIDAGRLPRNPKLLAAGLRIELTRARLRRAIPVVSGLDSVNGGDPEGQDVIKQIIRAHAGPIVIRAAVEGTLPLETGYVSFAIPTLTDSQRLEFWERALARAGLPVSDVEAIAGRFRLGPGVIERVIAEVATRRQHLGTDAGDDAGQQMIEAARQHIAIRLGHVANPVVRLAQWEQVSLPEDLLDSLKEFIARTRHRRTVYDRWGFDAKMTSSRGLSALFYGPPGTGKSMVAGLIARELGLELYRVDLARVVSKWIGETEKNLAEIFDAAEDGQVVILFDEADSLFAKRTEVKSSVDRYANLEVNYLLQRLDSFEGICILTTNIEGSVDQAFKRRMSLRLQFPFPDEDMRVRLWAAHVPADTPIAGDFDFVDLARRFPLSGGYIRNSVLRAAFLAAQEASPLGQDHLIRAIQLEYRELGKLSTTGRME